MFQSEEFIIPQGATLSGIAQQRRTTVPNLLKLNPNITNPDVIQAGARLNVPKIIAPSIITTDDLRTGFKENVNNLNQRLGLPTQATPQPTKEETVAPPPPSFLNISTLNPALQNLSTQMNNLLTQYQSKGGTITPEMQNRINQINTFELTKGTGLVGAKTAADKKDAKTLDESIKKVDETEAAQKDALTQLIEELKTSRQSFIDTLTPTQQETELRKKLIDLRTERQLEPMELRKEGISAAGIAGRYGESERVRGIQEQNLLLELGLEQEARQAKTLAAEKQISFIEQDMELQGKIEEKLAKQEQAVLEEARALRKESLSAMSSILESFEGLDFTDLDINTQAEVIDIARNNNIPLNILKDAMRAQKQQIIFDNAIKTKQEERLSRKSTETKAIEGERSSELRKAAFVKARPVLEDSVGDDGYVDTGVYIRLRSDYAEAIGDASHFDNVFSALLSPKERANLGVGKAVGVKADEEGEEGSTGFWNWLGNQF